MNDNGSPAATIRRHMERRGWRMTDFAKAMDIDIAHASRLVHGKVGVGPKTAERLAGAFKDTSAQFWLILQLQHRALSENA